jgi:hypothetical protein
VGSLMYLIVGFWFLTFLARSHMSGEDGLFFLDSR